MTKSRLEVPDREDSNMDVYTIALILLTIVVVGGLGYFVLRPEKS